MLFSERKDLAKRVDEYILENKIKPDTFGVICALSQFKMLANPVENRVSQPSELLPCPFCGGEGQYFCWDKPEGECYDIVCEDCPARSPIYKTMEEAKNFWNKRASQ